MRIRTNVGVSLDLAPDAPRPSRRPPPPALDTSKMTPGQKQKFLRNLGIVAGARAGVSQRELAQIYDLPHSRVAVIIAEFRQYAEGE